MGWRTTNGSNADVAIGNIVNGEFVAEDTWTDVQGYMSIFKLYFGTSSGGYKVFKVTPKEGYHLQGFNVGEAYEYGQFTDEYTNYPSKAVLGQWSGVLEVYGNMPYAIYNVGARTCKFIQSFDVTNIKSNTLFYSFAYDYQLENVDVSTWDLSNCTSLDSAFRETKLKWFNGYKSLNLSNVTALSSAFPKIEMEEFDMTAWELSKVTGMGSMFANSKIKTAKLKSSQVSCNYSGMFNNCNVLQNIDLSNFDTSLATSITSFVSGCTFLDNIDFESLDLSSITTAGNSQSVFNGARSIKSLTIPASLSIIGNSTFQNMEMCAEFHFLATTPPTLNNTNAFNSMNQRVTKTIYVPQGSLEAYQTATN